MTSLFASSREERKTIVAGFDVLPQDVRVLFEKISHHISTQNDCLNSDFLASITFEDESELTIGSIQALNSIDEGGRPPVVSIACSATYVVGFTRLEAEKEYEKQEVSIVFTGGRPGKVDISIRSTELTWPQSIRNLIEREVLSIGRRTVKEYRGERGYLFCATFSKR